MFELRGPSLVQEVAAAEFCEFMLCLKLKLFLHLDQLKAAHIDEPFFISVGFVFVGLS